MQTMQPVPRSQWVPDSQAPVCALCRANFDLLNRRHHCRFCGQVVCDACSTRTLRVRGESMRICDPCNIRSLQQPVSGAAALPPAMAPGQYPAQQAPQPYTMGQPVDALDAALQQFALENEIKPQYIPSLRRLADYDVVVVCDDSGSMGCPADPENPGLTRWAELKQSMAMLLKATAVFNKPVDVYFINRGVFRGITAYDQLAQAFQRGPSGGTNTVAVLNQVWRDRQVAEYLERPLMVHLFTDGHPTNSYGNEDADGFARWLSARPCLNRTFFAILLCCDDEEVCQIYRPLEYRVRGQFGWQGATRGIPGVDVTEDYRGELKDIRNLRGPRFPFSQGDYMVKCLVGAIDPQVHAIDLPAGASIYGNSAFGYDSGGCVVS